MRKLVILTQPHAELSAPLWLHSAQSAPPANQTALPFSKAKMLLGQEFAHAVYDMRSPLGVCLNLEALAIVAGTIQQGGTLWLICPAWADLADQLDEDALRWNEQRAIATPNFYRYFQQLIAEFGFKVDPAPPLRFRHFPQQAGDRNNIDALTVEQQFIFNHLPHHAADIHLITAPRGRGKSTLAGKLAAHLAKNHPVIITAKSGANLNNFHLAAQTDHFAFYAPDELFAQIQQKQLNAKNWLFIDEAASLPLPMLQQFCGYFAKVVLTTTTQNYEGTGRGFLLKFLPQLTRPSQHWQLTQPLRWQENDPLEQFIQQLIMLDEVEVEVKEETEAKPRNTQQAFYQLLAQAHYKTTTNDLRRLFDAPEQHYHQHIENQQLIAGAWLVEEGGLSEDLTQAIWRGERRPQGSLVAQYLCFQGDLPQACRLRSRRISRIAVRPEKQHQGIGKRLVSEIILQNQQNSTLDFLSVSFGLTESLLHFWQQCGFQLVQISQKPEASSGYHSAMMVLPLSEQGKQFAEKATAQFQYDFPQLPFEKVLQNIVQIPPLAPQPFTQKDWQNLQHFAHTARTFASCYASFKRFYQQNPEALPQLKEVFENNAFRLPDYKKTWVKGLREAVNSLTLTLPQEKYRPND